MSGFVEVQRMYRSDLNGGCEYKKMKNKTFLNRDFIVSIWQWPSSLTGVTEEDIYVVDMVPVEKMEDMEGTTFVDSASAARIVGKEYERGQIEGLIQQVQDIDFQFTNKEAI